MLILAIILLAVVVLLVIASLAGGTDDVSVSFFNVTVETTVGGVFVIGVVVGLIGLASLVMLRISLKRQRRRRRELRDLRRRADETEPAPDADRDREAIEGTATSETATDDKTRRDSAAGPSGEAPEPGTRADHRG